MLICKVTGTIVATVKNRHLEAVKLLIVHPVEMSGALKGAADLLALDVGCSAGPGDYVLVAREGAVVTQILDSTAVPANVIVLGVIDDWTGREDTIV